MVSCYDDIAGNDQGFPKKRFSNPSAQSDNDLTTEIEVNNIKLF
jgi:hypothetical protein